MIHYSHGHERRPVDRRVVDLHAAVVALRRLRRRDVYHVVGHRGQERGVRGSRVGVAGGARHRNVRVRRRELQLLQRLMVRVLLQMLMMMLLMVLLLLLLQLGRRRVERLRPAAATARVVVGRAEYGVDSVAVLEVVDVREGEGLGGVGGVAAPAQSLERLPQERVQPEVVKLNK